MTILFYIFSKTLSIFDKIIKASEENNLLEALTIQSLLINDLNISLISSNTVYEIVKSLNSFGLTEISRDFTREWIVSKIITNITEDYSK